MKERLTDWTGYYALLAASALARRVPAGIVLGTGSFVGWSYYWFSKRRRFAYADLKTAFGAKLDAKKRWKVVREHYRQIGRSAFEILRFPLLDEATIKKRINIHHIERFYEVAHSGKGAVLLTAHLGNWELIQIVSAILGYPVHALMRKQKHTRLGTLLNEMRRSRGAGLANTGFGLRGLLKALRNGELVGILGDQSAGRDQGILIPFFGRKTTLPTGAFEIAAKTGVPVLPVFIVRKKGESHEIFVEKPIFCREKEHKEEKFRTPVKQYLARLEELIEEYPDQWLWAKKRWKYSWTRRLVILSDGKAGHYKQSEALASLFREISSQHGREGMEYDIRKIEIRYRSPFFRKLLFLVAPVMLPWIQGRMGWLKLFLEPSSFDAVKETGADFVISAGSSVLPVNLLLSRENMCKRVVLMNPPFPYNRCFYDLAVVPLHDQKRVPKQSFRAMVTLSRTGQETVSRNVQQFQRKWSGGENVKTAVFLGGDTQGYGFDLSDVEKLMALLDAAPEPAGDYVVTTSRRTPETVTAFLKSRRAGFSRCRDIILATEDRRKGIPEAMMRLCDLLIVTADSISMISEAVSSGKRVVVLHLGKPASLPGKHRRFLSALEDRRAVQVAGLHELVPTLKTANEEPPSPVFSEERRLLKERLREIL